MVLAQPPLGVVLTSTPARPTLVVLNAPSEGCPRPPLGPPELAKARENRVWGFSQRLGPAPASL